MTTATVVADAAVTETTSNDTGSSVNYDHVPLTSMSFGDEPAFTAKTPDTPVESDAEVIDAPEGEVSVEADSESVEAEFEQITRDELMRLRELEAQHTLSTPQAAKEGETAKPVPQDFTDLMPALPRFDAPMSEEFAEKLGIDVQTGNEIFQGMANIIIDKIGEYIQQYTPIQAIASQAQYHAFLDSESQIFREMPEYRKHPNMVRAALVKAKQDNPDISPWDLADKAKEALSKTSKKADAIVKAGGTKHNQVPQGQTKALGTQARTPDVGGRNSTGKPTDPTEAALQRVAALAR